MQGLTCKPFEASKELFGAISDINSWSNVGAVAGAVTARPDNIDNISKAFYNKRPHFAKVKTKQRIATLREPASNEPQRGLWMRNRSATECA